MDKSNPGTSTHPTILEICGWSRYFAYDQYSNMWICGWPGIAPNGSAPVANYCSQTPSGIFNTANRIGTGSYDAAGNQLTVAGSNLTYDAENRTTKENPENPGTEHSFPIVYQPNSEFCEFWGRSTHSTDSVDRRGG